MKYAAKYWYILALFVGAIGLMCQTEKIPGPPLKVGFLNVGYGDATLLITPGRHTILIDGGDAGQGANHIGPLLDELHINRLDYVILTNFNPEHLNGISEVLQPLGGMTAINEAVYDPGGEGQADAFKRYVAAVGTKRRAMHLGQTIQVDGVRIACLAVNGLTESGTTFMAEQTRAVKPRGEDDRSLVLHVSHGDFDMVLGSDIHALNTREFRDLETELAPVVHRVDVYRANNHASVSSNSRNFLYALNPTVTIVSSGDNGRELTNPYSVRRILDTGSKVYLTNEVEGIRIKPRQGKAVNGDIWVRVFDDFYTVNKDTFRYRW